MPSVLQHLNPLARIAWLQLGIAGVLRVLWLARPDPFGGAMVDRFDWYIFHAIAFDCLQTSAVLLPILTLVAVGRFQPKTNALAMGLGRGLLAMFTVFAVVDQEFMRFMGTHARFDLLATYINGAAIAQAPTMLAEDAGGPFLGVLLCVGGGASMLWWSRPDRMPKPDKSRWLVASWCVMALLSYLFVNHIWGGSFRAWRLQTPLTLIHHELTSASEPPISAATLGAAAKAHQARHLALQPAGSAAGKDQEAFSSATYPLLHLSAHGRCAASKAGDAALAGNTPLGCDKDRDGDGYTLAEDCDDTQPGVHPGATETPSDGIDQDCNGVDLRPPNVLLLILETHRALHTGHLHPPTKGPSATPVLDKLAKEGLSFRRATANGLPTIAAFMAIHTGLLPHPGRAVATHFTQTHLWSLPQALGKLGYQRHFFTAADPSWDHQRFWLNRWYDTADYHRSRETDAAMFAHLGDWFRTDLDRSKPFFVAAMTRSNHFPFHRIDGVETTGGDSLPERMTDTMRYTDKAMASLLASMKADGLLKNTVVIITGDHGFPFGEHGITKLWATAHIEATGVPIVLWGDHPRVRGAGVKDTIASHIDIAPTVLDLVGASRDGAWMGSSLLRERRKPSAITLTGRQWALERGAYRVVAERQRGAAKASGGSANRGSAKGPNGGNSKAERLIYDRQTDYAELKPLSEHADRERATKWHTELADVAKLMANLYRTNRVWPTDWGK